jgi:hypothetical protein
MPKKMEEMVGGKLAKKLDIKDQELGNILIKKLSFIV